MSERRERATQPQGAGAEDWRVRVRRAARALDQPQLLAELALRVRAVELRPHPAAVPLAGRNALASARAVGLSRDRSIR